MFIVTNTAFQIFSPVASGFYKEKSIDPDSIAVENKGHNSPLVLPRRSLAEDFAAWLAQKNHGQRYYLFEMADYVQTADPPLQWKNKK